MRSIRNSPPRRTLRTRRPKPDRDQDCSCVSSVSSVVARFFSMLIYGINPVLEALRAGRVTSIRISPRADDRLTAVVRLADEKGVAVHRVSVADLDRAARGAE